MKKARGWDGGLPRAFSFSGFAGRRNLRVVREASIASSAQARKKRSRAAVVTHTHLPGDLVDLRFGDAAVAGAQAVERGDRGVGFGQERAPHGRVAARSASAELAGAGIDPRGAADGAGYMIADLKRGHDDAKLPYSGNRLLGSSSIVP